MHGPGDDDPPEAEGVLLAINLRGEKIAASDEVAKKPRQQIASLLMRQVDHITHTLALADRGLLGRSRQRLAEEHRPQMPDHSHQALC
jgi:hypothetical protein